MAAGFDGPVSSLGSVEAQEDWKTMDDWNQETSTVKHQDLDLNVLWEMLEKHQEVMKEKEEEGQNISTTWELVVVQGVILTILILISVLWAVCCRKKCFSTDTDVTVAAALRKLSKDLPPSYSCRDLHSLGITVNDHLHPPPAYLELFNDDLQYLDLEAGHSRMSRLSFCSPEGSVPRMARLSVASCATCSSDSPVIVPFQKEAGRERDRASVSSRVSEDSRKSSRSSKTSKVSFSEEVHTSNGSVRRLSPSVLSGLMQSSASLPSSRRSSSSSSGGKKSSLVSAVQEAKRKLGSQSSVNSESFRSQLDQELREKLDSVGKSEPEVETKSLDLDTPRTPEIQAERAARVCDILHEDRQ